MQVGGISTRTLPYVLPEGTILNMSTGNYLRRREPLTGAEKAVAVATKSQRMAQRHSSLAERLRAWHRPPDDRPRCRTPRHNH
jgi:hypothetical protein